MSDGKQYGPWQVLDRLGQGGQGEVFRVLDTRRVPLEAAGVRLAQACFELRQGNTSGADTKTWSGEVREALRTFAAADDPANMGALKVLSPVAGGANFEKGSARFIKEVRAYSEMNHPNILKLLDANEAGHWCVTEYYPARELACHQSEYTGNVEVSLLAFRGLVSGVAALHETGMVHRDIKPPNVFVGRNRQLVLGDTGLVFYLDEESRLTETPENVGSRDWMALGCR